MNASRYLRPEYTSKVIAAIFILVGIYLYLETPYVNAALASGFIGLFTILIVNKRTVEEETAIDSLKSGVLSYDRLLDDLEVEGNGMAVPPGRNLTEARVYVPVRDSKKIPDLYDEMTIVSTGRGKVGVSLEPPGDPLFERAKQNMEYDLEGQGIEAARECMEFLSQGTGLAKSFGLRRGDRIKLRLTHGKYRDYCEGLRERSEKLCTRTGCPICNSYLLALCEGLSRPVRIEEFEKDGPHIKYTLEVV